MIPWYLNPKTLALIVLAAAVIYFGSAYLIQRTTIAKQAADIQTKDKSIADLNGQVKDYKANIAAAKKAHAAQQQIADETARLLAEANKITAACTLGGDDEKTLSVYTYYFNSGGLRVAGSDSKAGPKVLPAAGPARAGGSGWTLRQLAENYLIVIDYTLKMEKTIGCYEASP